MDLPARKRGLRAMAMAHAVAILAVALALALRLALEPWLHGEAPLQLFALSVMIAAWYGGFGPGIAATVISALAGFYVLIEPRYSFTATSPAEYVRMALFLGVGAGISWLSEALLRSKRNAERELELRLEAEAAERVEAARLSLAAEGAGLGTWERNIRTGELIASEAFSRLYGYGPEEPVTSVDMVFRRIHPEDMDNVHARVTNAIEGKGDYDAEYRVVWPDASVHWVHSKGRLLRDAHGKPDRLVGITMDVTERVEREAAMRETAKLESLGVLAGGIAHDFNNLLTGVMGHASLLEDALPEGSPERESAALVVAASERMARLTSQMLAYSGKGRFTTELVDFSKQVSQTTALIQASIPKQVELRLKLANGLPVVEADSTQIQQVIMNLVINAGEAIGPEGGVVEVATDVWEVTEADLAANLAPRSGAPGRHAVLSVSDTGAGMDEATRNKIFDPFFTTKFTGRGLGLSAVLGIVRGHGGLLTLETAPGKGSTFRVFLPVSERQPRKIAAEEKTRSEGSGLILVVDDEAMVRRTAKSALESRGYRVLLAEDGLEAIEIFRARGSEIGAAVIDLTMPRLGGVETAAELRRIRPDVRIIGSSGFSEAEAAERFGAGIAGFVQKPYTAQKLAAIVEEGLDRGEKTVTETRGS
jgi:two-component system, cell cycle sensor histidine kinase and response regulator CckA